ncbi:hypothetical protein [Pseudomonas typographi]|uniref:Uncharacterized protein n=1 Tax=Pseudomonas typographi TaxID=2715964 RepID=A0ABR7Z9Y4_9PSED|nr:hypothetical protein [Pseudomonas typographi]MBD1555092.1 hypothetical protein [Pseudomonas typographi]MBD1589996.1 hypothetical protein [Pseudomonas typographi]MBD1602235.1 hypothetical protein [Pseudomonas typographi]
MSDPDATAYATQPVRERLTERIRNLHREPHRSLATTIGEIMGSIKELRTRGQLSHEEAVQFIYDVRNEKGRIMR